MVRSTTATTARRSRTRRRPIRTTTRSAMRATPASMSWQRRRRRL